MDFKSKQKQARADLHKIYQYPLPLIPLPSPSPLRRIFSLLLPTEKFRPIKCSGLLNRATRSVWITDPADIRTLWTHGFFGKGSLSRTEPLWMKRQKMSSLTPEEITRKRRKERQEMKLARSELLRSEQQKIEDDLRAGRIDKVPELIMDSLAPAFVRPYSPQLRLRPEDQDDDQDQQLEDMEHLQLTLAEAFFLSYFVNCLSVIDPLSGPTLTNHQFWRLCHQPSLTVSSSASTLHGDTCPLSWDNPFMIDLAITTHYRRLGWVIKSGIKFCTDYVLYQKGPVFSHSEFSLLVLPTYEDPALEDKNKKISWQLLSTINRVNSQVKKAVVLCYITIPRVGPNLIAKELENPRCLKRYKIEEIILKRFVPQRMID